MDERFKNLEGIDERRRHLMLGAAAFSMLPLASSPVHAQSKNVTLEGIEIEESIMLDGKKLVLNGAALRKRGYFKSDITALYVTKKSTDPKEIYKLDGPCRIQLNFLRKFSVATVERIFLSDFKLAATDEEFNRLAGPIGDVGLALDSIKTISKGDVLNLDWVPSKGWMATHNGKNLTINGTSTVINNKLAFQLQLRAHLGPNVPEELRSGLLGL